MRLCAVGSASGLLRCGLRAAGNRIAKALRERVAEEPKVALGGLRTWGVVREKSLVCWKWNPSATATMHCYPVARTLRANPCLGPAKSVNLQEIYKINSITLIHEVK